MPDVSGRLVLWTLELTQYDIKYKSRMTIKAQALADFVGEFSMVSDQETISNTVLELESREWPFDNKTWTLFEFRATNNEAKYEALLAEMKVAEELGADFLLVKSDSKLVVNQVSRLYHANGDNMISYLKQVQKAIGIRLHLYGFVPFVGVKLRGLNVSMPSSNSGDSYEITNTSVQSAYF
ncbi:hypothetical protein LWI28_005866 [Acer negundo]|uniref:RNase H type-1 domain-containing protein n=1 Tax=Acer negundo TaxID=4023 RepID=A0AAD5IXM6_ACENE|nr:hypothetical protein LWI28_005866 [Acer negundo]